jgi:hypothetical protein
MKSYLEIFEDNLTPGAKSGSSNLIGFLLAKKFPIFQHPFLNRLFEISAANIIQHNYINKISFSEKYTESFFYHGVFQAVKWLPNFWVQNQVREILPDNPIKEFIVPCAGMTFAFAIVDIDSRIADPKMKLLFTSTLATAFSIAPSLYELNETIKTQNNAVFLSPQDTWLTQMGLIGSYFTLYIAQKLEIADSLKSLVNLPILTTSIMIASEAVNLASTPNLTLSNSTNTLLSGSMRIAGFSVAKAIAVTGIEFISNNMDISAEIAASIYVAHSLYNENHSFEDILYAPVNTITSVIDMVGEYIALDSLSTY